MCSLYLFTVVWFLLLEVLIDNCGPTLYGFSRLLEPVKISSRKMHRVQGVPVFDLWHIKSNRFFIYLFFSIEKDLSFLEFGIAA